MAGETGEVSSIGVKLTLDASGFMGGIESASGQLNKLQAQAQKAGSGAGQMKAGGGKQAASGVTGTGTSVGVNLTVSAAQLRQLRSEITSGLGAIPVTITPRFATSGPQSIQNIMGSMLSMQYGASPAVGRRIAKQAIDQFVPKAPTPRAYGGPVQANRDYLVGERRAEVFRPRTSGSIHPDAARYYREEEQRARQEASEYRRHQDRMRRMSGGPVDSTYRIYPISGKVSHPDHHLESKIVLDRRRVREGDEPMWFQPWHGDTGRAIDHLGRLRDWNNGKPAGRIKHFWVPNEAGGSRVDAERLNAERRMGGGPTEPQGPLQRRLAGLPPLERPQVQVVEQRPVEPEWIRRARASKLPPKQYRYRGGPTLRQTFPNAGSIDLSGMQRRERLDIGKQLLELGRSHPVAAERINSIRSQDPSWFQGRFGGRAGTHTAAVTARLPQNILDQMLGEEREYTIRFNSGMRDRDVNRLGRIPSNWRDAAVHEYGHLVDFVNGDMSGRRPSSFLAGVSKDPMEDYADRFLMNWRSQRKMAGGPVRPERPDHRRREGESYEAWGARRDSQYATWSEQLKTYMEERLRYEQEEARSGRSSAGGFQQEDPAAYWERRRQQDQSVPVRPARGDPRSQIDKLRAMAGQEAQSPNEAAIARRILREKGIPGYSRGGSVEAGLTRRQRSYTANIRAAADRLSPEVLQAGREWYPGAEKWIAGVAAKYGKSEPMVRGMAAALSAGTSWRANKAKLLNILDADANGGSFPYPDTIGADGKARGLNAHRVAKRILEGQDPQEALGHTPKTWPFFQNTGGDLEALTLDRWAFRTGTLGAIEKYGKGPVRTGVDRAFRKVAREQGVHPVELQAALWIQEKYERDLAKYDEKIAAGHKKAKRPTIAQYMRRGGDAWRGDYGILGMSRPAMDIVGPPMAELPRVVENMFREQGPQGRAGQLWDAVLSGRVPGGMQGLAWQHMPREPKPHMAGGPVRAFGGTWLKGNDPIGHPLTKLKKAGKPYAVNAPGRPKEMVAGRLEYDSISGRGKGTLEEALAAIEQHNLTAGEGPAITYMHGKPPEAPAAVGPGLRQAYVESIRQLNETGSAIDPSTGKPLMALSKDHGLKILRDGLRALPADDLSVPVAPFVPQAEIVAGTPHRKTVRSGPLEHRRTAEDTRYELDRLKHGWRTDTGSFNDYAAAARRGDLEKASTAKLYRDLDESRMAGRDWWNKPPRVTSYRAVPKDPQNVLWGRLERDREIWGRMPNSSGYAYHYRGDTHDETDAMDIEHGSTPRWSVPYRATRPFEGQTPHDVMYPGLYDREGKFIAYGGVDPKAVYDTQHLEEQEAKGQLGFDYFGVPWQTPAASHEHGAPPTDVGPFVMSPKVRGIQEEIEEAARTGKLTARQEAKIDEAIREFGKTPEHLAASLGESSSGPGYGYDRVSARKWRFWAGGVAKDFTPAQYAKRWKAIGAQPFDYDAHIADIHAKDQQRFLPYSDSMVAFNEEHAAALPVGVLDAERKQLLDAGSDRPRNPAESDWVNRADGPLRKRIQAEQEASQAKVPGRKDGKTQQEADRDFNGGRGHSTEVTPTLMTPGYGATIYTSDSTADGNASYDIQHPDGHRETYRPGKPFPASNDDFWAYMKQIGAGLHPADRGPSVPHHETPDAWTQWDGTGDTPQDIAIRKTYGWSKKRAREEAAIRARSGGWPFYPTPDKKEIQRRLDAGEISESTAAIHGVSSRAKTAAESFGVPHHEAPEVIAHAAIANAALERRAAREAEEQARVVAAQAEAKLADEQSPMVPARPVGYPRTAEQLVTERAERMARERAAESRKQMEGLGLLTVTRRHRAAGGPAGEGLYIVNEVGPEAFIEQRDIAKLAANRPDILARVPHAADGARTGMIDKPAWGLFSPQKDGIIVRREDAHEALRAVRAQDGIRADQDRAGGGPLWTPGRQAGPQPELLVAPSQRRRMTDEEAQVAAANNLAAAMARAAATIDGAAQRTGHAFAAVGTELHRFQGPVQQGLADLGGQPGLGFVAGGVAPGLVTDPYRVEQAGIPAPSQASAQALDLARRGVRSGSPRRYRAEQGVGGRFNAASGPGETLYGGAPGEGIMFPEATRQAAAAAVSAAGLPTYQTPSGPQNPRGFTLEGEPHFHTEESDQPGGYHDRVAQPANIDEARAQNKARKEARTAGVDSNGRPKGGGLIAGVAMTGGKLTGAAYRKARAELAGYGMDEDTIATMIGPGAENLDHIEHLSGPGMANLAHARKMGQIKRDMEGGDTEVQDVLTTARERVAGSASLMAERNPKGVAAVLGALGLGGGMEFKRKQARFQTATTELRKAGRGEEKAQANVDMWQANVDYEDNTAEDAAIATKQLSIAQDILAKKTNAVTAASEKFVKAEDDLIPSLADTARNFAGIMIGTTLYAKGLEALGFVMQGVTPGVKDMVDMFLGFGPNLTKVSGVMGDSMRQMGGNYQAAFAATAVTAGWSNATSDWAKNGLQATVTAKAGAKAYGDLSEIFRAAMGAYNKQGTEGLYGGYGGLMGGPLFGSQLGGGKGLTEQMIQDINRSRGDTGIDWLKYGSAAASGNLSPLINDVVTGQFGVSAGSLPSKPGQAETAITDQIDAAMKRAQGRDQGPGYKIEYRGQAAADAYKNAQLPQMAKNLGAVGYAVVDSAGNITSSLEDVNKALEQFATGLTIPDVETWAATMERQVNAQFQMIDIQGAITRGLIIPMQFATQRIQNPVTAPGAGVIPGSGMFGSLIAAMNRMGVPTGQATDAFAQQSQALLGAPTAQGGFGLSPEVAKLGASWMKDAFDIQAQQVQKDQAALGTAYTQILNQPSAEQVLADSTTINAPAPPEPLAPDRVQKYADEVLAPDKIPPEKMTEWMAAQNQVIGEDREKYGRAAQGDVQAQAEINAEASRRVGLTTKGLEAPPTGASDTVPPPTNLAAQDNKAQADQYLSLMTSAQKASTELKGLQGTLSDLSAAASKASWANTTRLSLRGIADATNMLTKGAKAAGGELGTVQRALWDVSRKSQALDLQLQQRQITTQLALAQFQAPGETGEERYFRQKESIVKAGIEQQKLGYAKETYSLTGQEWKIQAQRNLLDAQEAWKAAQKANDAQQAAGLAQAKIAALSSQIASDLATADSILSDSTTKSGVALTAAKTYVENFGGKIAATLTPLGNFGNTLGASAKGMEAFLKALGFTFKTNQNGTTTVTGPTVNGQAGASTTTAPTRVTATTAVGIAEVLANRDLNNNGVIGAASGALFNTTRPTDLTVGEAKGETVAVLRNPRAASMNEFGGGSSNVTVNINGASVRNDNDISSLARQVAAEVERSLSRKGQMFGLRGPSV
jgi:hypothetical protein